jgi:predicted ArsR family transcriptional regulator
MHLNDNDCTQIVDYLLGVQRQNARAEASSVELSRALQLDPHAVRTCLEDLVATGWADGDLFPLVVWVRLTPEGVGRAEGAPGR